VVSTIEELQNIVADENRPAEEREAAAKHILALQGQPAAGPADERSEHQKMVDGIKAYIDSLPAYQERRAAPAVANNAPKSAESPKPKAEKAPTVPPHGISPSMIQTAIRACDLQLSELEGQQPTSMNVDMARFKVPKLRG
jgi:hypothetical protein